MDLLDERPVWSMSDDELLSALDATQAELARLQVRRMQLSGALDSRGYAREVGARDTAQLLSVRYRLDPAEVRRELRLASALHKYPTVEAAIGMGHTVPPDAAASSPEPALNLGQAAAIVAALEKVPSAKVPAEDLQVAEQAMVDAAGVLSPDELRKLGSEVRNRLDTDGPEPDPDPADSRETLWLKKADRGVSFGGYLADENAELLQTLIFAGAKPRKAPDGSRDPRPRGKRQSDALVAILTSAAGDGSAVPGHGDIKPHITVTIDLDDLKASTGAGELVHGDFLPAAAVRRLACDAGIIPLVLGSKSEPLDVGAEHRFVTRAIRQALNARDKGCVVCGAPPAICEAHHAVHWADGGPTSLDNLALLCKRDHINVHRGRISIRVINGSPVATRPAWSDPDPPPLPRTA